ncbi:MAG: FtsW/RodA/SpoVE family cell cycle protein [Fimbriimonadaceae bacterium]|nr:FtsW/RodA/SpoVE family cell cycle protein [Fimbriimonadaceae bacterium]
MGVTTRRRERWLLQQVTVLLSLLLCGLAGWRHLQGQPLPWRETLAVAGFVTGLGLLHRALVALDLQGDESLVPLIGWLTGLGLVIKLRLTSVPVQPSTLLPYAAALAALLLAVWVCRHRLAWLDATAWLAGLAAFGLLVLLVRAGVRFRGAMFGPGLTTPSELLKPLLVIFLAGFLKRRRGWLEVLAFAAVWTGVQLLLVKQSDLGMVVITGALLLSMFYVATGRTRFLLAGLGAVAVGSVVLFYLAPLSRAAGRGSERIVTWLNPWSDPAGAGYQTLQALFALRAGGWEGSGLGRGSPSLTPLVSSDFVYAALAEEFGLLGCGLVLACYLALFRRGWRIATLASDPFRQRLAIGCVTVLAIQTLLNIGGVVRFLPITGITLPLVSHGGSSLVVSHLLLGLLLAVGHDLETAPPGRRRRGTAEAFDPGAAEPDAWDDELGGSA